ncbi:AAA family ATPase, partial [candidate division KSB1 bacterium]|nr:AAA family ATPase [candidate division KSB1 bacterium]
AAPEERLIDDMQAAALYITHNLGVVAQVCDQVIVMYAGEIMADGSVKKVFIEPIHPYTIGLLNSIPKLGQSKRQGALQSIEGSPPSLKNPPKGCVFAQRCPAAVEKCYTEKPELEHTHEGRLVRCHRWQEIHSGVLDIIPETQADVEQVERLERESLLKVENMTKHFGVRRSLMEVIQGKKPAPIRAVDGVNFGVQKGRTLGLVGESGSGKTTLARIIARHTKADFFQLNAVASGVKDVREVLDKAARNRKHFQRNTILFIDEIHRFNKAQQDALLHSVEDGLITLIGATTENPSFEVISPLLSRSRVYVLQPLTNEHLRKIIDHALKSDWVLGKQDIYIDDREYLIHLSGGDARMLLNGLETAINLTKPDAQGKRIVKKQHIEEAFQRKYLKYDKGGEEHYNVISAFIKSVRGSDPDASVYWLARMLEGGEDPKFIARRLIILASEDIGNADPMGLVVATSAFTAITYIGLPEGALVLAQATTYLASAPKSNASYLALKAATQEVKEKPLAPIPLHIRNAPTGLLAAEGYGLGYKYPHDFPGHFVEQNYLPGNLTEALYYRPSQNGAEVEMSKRLQQWWEKYRKENPESKDKNEK